MTLLVCGGRDYNDRATLFRVLDAVHAKSPVKLLIAGGATGADTLAAQWADERGVEKIVVVAEWAAHGPAAGPLRNSAMVQLLLISAEPHGVVAMPGGRGTADLMRRARNAGVTVWEPLRRSPTTDGRDTVGA